MDAGADVESKDNVRCPLTRTHLCSAPHAPAASSRARQYLKPALAHAAEAGSLDVVKLLIEAKAPLQENDFVRGPLYMPRGALRSVR